MTIMDWLGENTAAIQAISMVILIVVTGIYAWRTHVISKAANEQAEATRQQADASVKMVKGMREQRYSESLPLLVPDITPTINKGPVKPPPNEVPFDYIKTGVTVTWRNSGKGIAINARFSYWAPPHESHPGKVPYFEAHESKVFQVEKEIVVELESGHQWLDEREQYQPRVEAEYNDIYERKITTVQEFRIEEQNGNKRAFLGDLYFTVNGKRLGEEVSQND